MLITMLRFAAQTLLRPIATWRPMRNDSHWSTTNTAGSLAQPTAEAVPAEECTCEIRRIYARYMLHGITVLEFCSRPPHLPPKPFTPWRRASSSRQPAIRTYETTALAFWNMDGVVSWHLCMITEICTFHLYLLSYHYSYLCSV